MSHFKIVFVFICLFVFCIEGCSGVGSHKKMTLIPDKFRLTCDVNPQNEQHSKWNIDEISIGCEWNLK